MGNLTGMDIDRIKGILSYQNLSATRIGDEHAIFLPGAGHYTKRITAYQAAAMHGQWITVAEINHKGALSYKYGSMLGLQQLQHSGIGKWYDSITVECELDLGYAKLAPLPNTIPYNTGSSGNILLSVEITTENAGNAYQIVVGNHGNFGKQIRILLPTMLACDKFVLKYRVSFAGINTAVIDTAPNTEILVINTIPQPLAYFKQKE